MENFSSYFKALQSANLSEITEHSLRPELKTLLSAVANAVDCNISILHEGKKEGKFGAPDFKITRLGNIAGYIENKKIGEDLDKILKSEQIRKYRMLSDNILITNYLEWIWLSKDGIQRKTLGYLSDIEDKKAKPDPQNIKSVNDLIKGFFSSAPEGIGKPKVLAAALAVRGKMLKDFLSGELERQEKEDAKGRLYGLWQTFQKYVFKELSLGEFADAFSQNLIYGLFLAKLNADAHTVTLSNAEDFIPTNFELIRELAEFLKVLNRKEYADIRWVAEEVLSIFNTMNFREIKAALSFAQTFSEQEDPYAAKDPYIYFYEDFLAEYDKKLRKSKGVYYTPPQVVNFIVRSVNGLLKEVFHLPEGLANHEKVTVLDFAAGTGTFLLEVIRQIFKDYPDAGEKELIIRDHILKNLYGFEYLIAPYTIAHLKLSQFLKDHGYDLNENERLQIFLTNTLEPADRQISIPLLPALSEETKQAQIIKDQPVLVIMGNPPYSYESKNKGEWISAKIKDYYMVDGKKLDERNPKGLQDDYVKFIRFAQDKMEQVTEGIVAIITNHSFLDNPTFRGMRQSLMNTFHQLYFIDLHGNAKKKEKTPQRGKDENVFDIEQGVAISIMVKKPGLEKKVYHADFWGTRENKYRLCLEKDLNSVKKSELKPNSPCYLFQYRDETLRKHYENGQIITEIFNKTGVGVATSRDTLTIHYSKEEVLTTIKKFAKLECEEARKIFAIGEDAKDWKIELAQKDLLETNFDNNKVIEYLYRPFDKRHTYYTGKIRGFHSRPRKEIMGHLLHPNYAIFIGRQGQAIGESDWNLIFCGNGIEDYNLFRRGNNACIPLYLYENSTDIFAKNGVFVKTENFTKNFRQFIDDLHQKQYAPENILGYIYAVLYSPGYRRKYAEFLKTDFPRIPFVNDIKIFEKLSALGWDLIQAHLLNTVPEYSIGEYKGKGDHRVVKPEYRKNTEYERVHINADQYFDNVPENVWQFQIGGYQVLAKYLKDRKKRILTLAEVRNLKNIIRVLAFSIEQMHKIDEMTKEWI
ncbi:MAG: type ISP restriction/modification enzyme [Desulfococcaceae bacterium]